MPATAPAEVVAAYEGEDQQKRATEKVRNPIQSIRRWLVSFDSAILASVMTTASDPDGHVDEEDPPPADAAGDGPADQRADGDGAADDGAVDPEGGAPVPAREGLGDRASEVANMMAPPTPCTARARLSMREASTARTPGRRARRRPARRRTPRGGRNVAHHPGGEQEGGQRQRVGVDHPLEVGEARVEGPLDVGEGDVHDGDVEQQHEGGRADGDEGPPFAVERWHLRSVSTRCSPSYNVVVIVGSSLTIEIGDRTLLSRRLVRGRGRGEGRPGRPQRHREVDRSSR